MKKMYLLLLTVVLTSCSGNSKEENEENIKFSSRDISPHSIVASSNKNKLSVKTTKKIDVQKQSDVNKDGVINGNDWNKLNRQQKIDLVNFYTDLTYRSLGITPSKEVKDKEVFRMIPKLNSYYAKSVFGKSLYNPDASADRRVYDAMLATK